MSDTVTIAPNQTITYKIFLASSYKLKKERDEFKKDVDTINQLYAEYNIRLDLILWETLDSGITLGRKQDFYNQSLSECDILVLMIWGELGKFTLEEYRFALRLLKETGKPKIYIYEKEMHLPKNLVVPKENIDNLEQILQELATPENEQWTHKFKHSDTALKKFWFDIRKFIDHKHLKSNQLQAPNVNRYDNLMKDIALYGRGDDVKKISALLYDHNNSLITLIGAGGTGKSALANRVAHENKKDFTNGAILVELAPLREGKQIVTAIAIALNNDVRINANEESDAQQLIAFLKDKQMIIILDNCEYLVKECAALVSEVSKSCRDIKIIATSQVALEVPSERFIQVRPLDQPVAGNKISEIASNPCIQLFLFHAQNADPDFTLSERTKDAIIAICNLRAGIPLGIILAASALRMKSIEDIRSGISEHLESTYERFTDNNKHHQSLVSAIDWSYNLLNEDEKGLFKELCIFRDDFTEEAAKTVSSADHDFEPGFYRLVSVSMLTPSIGQALSSKTFYILEPLRKYGKKRYKNEPGYAETVERFVQYYVSLSAAFFNQFFTEEQELQLMKIKEQYNNIIEAVSLAKDYNHWIPAAKICGYLWRFWEVKAQFREGISQIGYVYQKPGIDGEIYLELLHGLGMLYYRGGDLNTAITLFDDHLKEAEKYADTKFGKINMAHALNNIANFKSAKGITDSEKLLMDAYKIFTEFNDKRMIAVVQNNLGNLFKNTYQLTTARDYYRQSIKSFEEQKNFWESGYPLFGLGSVYFQLKEFTEAKVAFDRAYERRAKVGDQRNMGRCEYYLALLDLENSELKSSLKRLERSMKLLNEVNDSVSLCELELAFARYCYTIGLYEMSVRLYYHALEKGKDHLLWMEYIRKISLDLINDVKVKTDPVQFAHWENDSFTPDLEIVLAEIRKFIKAKQFKT